MGKRFSANLKPGDVVALSGDLGAGKTVFVQGVAEGLGIKGRISSPTFIIMRSYGDFYHVDLYRLEGEFEKEITNLGLSDIIRDGNSIVLVEWAEKIRDLLPKSTIWVNIDLISETERKINIKK